MESRMLLKGYGVLQIEPTDVCNLQCQMCAPHHEQWDTIHGVPKGYLSLSLWKSIVDSFVQNQTQFDHIIFQWLGDPMLHPDIVGLISEAQRRLIGLVSYLRVDTNAILLTPERSAQLADAALKSGIPLLIVCSIDAHQPNTYLEVKGRDRLQLVRRNVRALLRARQRLGEDCRINIQVQFVVQEGNQHETVAFLKYWQDALRCHGDKWHDEVMFKRLSVGGGSAGQAAADELYAQAVSERGIVPDESNNPAILTWEQRPWQRDDKHAPQRGACPGLWLTPVIRHDGELQMCCSDMQGGLALGSLASQSFEQLWLGPSADSHRKAHIGGQFEGPCKDCGGINWYSLSPDRLRETKERIRRRSQEKASLFSLV